MPTLLYPCHKIPAALLAGLMLTASFFLSGAQAETAEIAEIAEIHDDDRTAAAPLKPFRFAPQAQHFTLANGMQAVVIPDHRSPLVIHMLWYRVGAADETPGKTGLAHFLEHLIFKGTEAVSGEQFNRMISGFGGNFNAFTSYDYTVYHERISRNHLGDVMALEADRMRGVIMTEAEIATERKVVLEERALRVDSQPGGAFHEQMNALSHFRQPYGHPVIGWADDIRDLDITDIRAFYDHYYTPEDAILIVVGDVTTAQVKQLAERHYGTIKARGSAPSRPPPAQIEGGINRRFVIRDARVQTPRLQRHYRAPSYGEIAAEETAALEIAVALLGSGKVGRLHERLVDRDGIAVAVGASYHGLGRYGGGISFYATPAPGVALATIEAALDAEIARLIEEPLDRTALQRAKNSQLGGLILALDAPATLAYFYGAAITLGLPLDFLANLPYHIDAVTDDMVLAMAQQVLRPENATTGYLIAPIEE